MASVAGEMWKRFFLQSTARSLHSFNAHRSTRHGKDKSAFITSQSGSKQHVWWCVCARAWVRVCASEFVGKRAHTQVLLIGTVGGVLE